MSVNSYYVPTHFIKVTLRNISGYKWYNIKEQLN